jgi:predicted N-formylglutamate amidohydrolase
MMDYKHNVIATVTRTITYEFELEAFTNDPDGNDEIKDQAIEEFKRLDDVDKVLVDVLNDELDVEDIQITQTWTQGGVD